MNMYPSPLIGTDTTYGKEREKETKIVKINKVNRENEKDSNRDI